MATAKEQLYFLEFLLLFSPTKLTLSSEGAVIGEPVPRADVHEWNNGTSFIYTLHPSDPTCQVLHFQVGFLRPNCLHGPTYLGQQHVGNFLSNVWEKVDFIVCYEDVLTRRPVKWIFYSGYTAKVMTFEVGAGAVLA